jgi:hypothetical protein
MAGQRKNNRKGQMRTPKRIQLKRTLGWRLPPNTVVVSRGPGRKWGNPWRVREGPLKHLADDANHQEAVEAYRQWLHERVSFQWEIKRELRGKNLACWCPQNKPCHADVMLEVANTKKLI